MAKSAQVNLELKQSGKTMEQFYENNPGFDILTFNFLNPDSVSALRLPETGAEDFLERLKSYQRLLRLYPSVSVADTLISEDINSSVKIANLSQSVFIGKFGPKFGADGNEIARKIYNAAVDTNTKIMHLVSTARGISSGGSFSNMLANNVSEQVRKVFEDLPSYQDFFGSLDYCSCDECKSIFGAAAYLVDLLRIIEKGITQPNTGILDGLHFFDRRPDIKKIELTCENTNNLIPYLQIVNNLLAETLKNYLTQNNSLMNNDVYLTLANTYYPFNLPFHLPLQQIETVLDNKNILLSDVEAVFSKDSAMSANQARKVLGLSIETLENLKSHDANSLPAIVSKNYGVTVTSGNLAGLDQVPTFLAQTGLALTDLEQLLTENLNAKEFFDVTGLYTTTVFGPDLTLRQTGSSIIGTYGTDGKLKGSIDGTVVRGQWMSASQAPPATNGDFEFTFTTDGASFSGKWSKGLGMPWETSAWNGTLNGSSTQGIIPHSLFINSILPAKQYLQIVPGDSVDTIAGQSIETLDRLNRFIRLSGLLGWSYADLNWILTTLNSQDISDSTFLDLAKIKQCIDKYNLDLNLLSCLWFDIKTIGLGQGFESQAPFDQIFNSPTIIQQTGKTYHPAIAASSTSFVNPLYKDETYLFVINLKLYEGSNPDPATKQRVANGQIIIKGIPASQDDILKVAAAAFGEVETIELTVSNLSTLYRHIMLARQLNTTIDRYLVLFKLLDFIDTSGGISTIKAILDRDEVLLLLKTFRRIQNSGFTVYDIDYLLNQTIDNPVSPYVNNGYKLSDLPAFLSSLSFILTGSAAQENSFTFNSLTSDDSAQIFTRLVSFEVIGSTGLVIKDAATLTNENWETIFIGQYIQRFDFVYESFEHGISRDDSKTIFDDLIKQGILDESGLIVNVLSAIDWNSILIGSTPAKLDPVQQEFVLDTLQDAQQNLDDDQKTFVISKLQSLQTHQAELFANQIGAFFGVTEDIASKAIDTVRGKNEAYLEIFIVAPNAPPTAAAKTFILNVSKSLMLQRIPALTLKQFSSICLTPDAYILPNVMDSILDIANLKSVMESFSDTDNKLLQYFRDVWSDPQPSADSLQTELCAITNWNKQQYISAAKAILSDPVGCKTLSDVIAVSAIFNITNALGTDVFSLQSLNQTTSLPATDANWSSYIAVAAKLLLTLQATTSSEAIKDQYKQINGIIETKKRDAMVFFCIWVLGQTWKGINNTQNLYEFLLIDPENGGCAEVSLVEEAMNAAQLYLQRCRLKIEENVQISTDDIPDVWWEWMMNYRVWQANREIFVYPENYIEPSLRKSRSSIFDDLENTVMQGEVTKELVENAFVKYLDDFSDLANLQYVDAYQTVVHDKERGPIDTLYLIARTRVQPYHFYYITREKVGNCDGDDQYLWSEWKNINIKIDAEHITPVYAFNRLFVFWVELTKTKESGGLTEASGAQTTITPHSTTVTKATVKYSYYNFNEKWVQPQVLFADKVINISASDPAIYGSFYQYFTDTGASCWNRISVIRTGPENYVGGVKSADEKLIVYFGPLANFEDLNKIPVIPDPVNDSTSVYAFKNMLKEAYFNLEKMEYFNLKGYTPLLSYGIIDEILGDQIILRQNEFLVLANDTLSEYMTPNFAAYLSDSSMAVTTIYSTVASNNSDGIENNFGGPAAGPQSVTETSFVVYPYIDSDQSASILANIKANMPEILNNNVITQAALDKTVSDISFKLNISENQARLVQNQFFALFYGSRVLFSNVAHNAQIVPVKNQPNAFVFDNGSETFLLTAVNNVIEETVGVLNPDSFVSGSIDKNASEAFFLILSTPPNNYIQSDGTVNSALLKNATKFSLSHLLGVSTDEAETILNILTAASQGTPEKVVKKDYTEIDTQIRITAALTPDCFVSDSINPETSDTYFGILSTAPNNYINPDGSVNLGMVKVATKFSIAQLLGLQSTDPNVTRILYILKSAANLITPDSFVTLAINPATNKPYIDQQQSESYYSILSLEPNNYILPDGTVNQALLRSATVFSMARLLNLKPYDFATAKVLNVLKNVSPVSLGYAFPEESDSQAGSKVVYEHDNLYSLQFRVDRLSTGAISKISNAISFGGIDTALELDIQQPPVTITKPFSLLGPTSDSLVSPLTGPVIIPPEVLAAQEVSFSGPYGSYYWELFFHAPFLVSSMLNGNQQFSDAENWQQYIFNPTMPSKYLTEDVFIEKRPADIDAGEMQSIYPILTTAPNKYIDENGSVTDLAPKATAFALSKLLNLSLDQAREILNLLNNFYVNKPQVRAWQFEPFRNYTLKTLLENLSSCAQIAVYNDDPFDPDAVARLRIGAYEKTIVMHYIDNLIDWGDFEFTQYTWESITTARMLYSYAYDLLGPKPVDLGSCQSAFPVTFQDIDAKYKGDIPQFLIDMEHLSNDGPVNVAAGNPGKAFNDLGDYFCIPDNQQLAAYWDRIEDRLYKIRHCLNIDGVAEPLPLFAPPINPMDLVRASAQGGNILNIANQQQQNISYYRFTYLIERARAYTELVSEFGNSLLSALEKSDAEALALLNLNQSKVILNMTLIIKNKQLEGLENQLSGLQESLQSAQNRYQFYTTLINAGYNSSENTALSYMQDSIVIEEVVAGIQGVSIAGYLAPCIFGFSDGGMKFGDAINMGAQILQTSSQILTQKAGSLETVAQYQRRAEDWKLQQQLAQYDINQIQDQILSMQTNISSSQEEIDIQKKSIDQNLDEITFYQNKFTNQQLYQWMVSRLSAVYFQAYKLALDVALTAQMSYQYELDRADSYITFSYWDNLYKGLLAADGLKLSLAQLENAYTMNNERRLEIEKTISLKTLNPEAFYAFLSGSGKGALNFSLTEELFDRDFPSHYCRRIKTVSVSIPAIIGPYQNIHATLTQNTNLVVLTNDKNVVNYAIYQTAPQKSGTAPPEPQANAMRQNWVSSQQIALSKGIDDSGMFVLNFDDQRYLPFEGTGAVSTWTLSMPPGTNQIDFSGISDIILTVKYTAKEGGSVFGNDVLGLYTGTDKQYQNIRINSFDLSQAFATAWYNLFQIPPDVNKQQTIIFPVSDNVVLPNLQNVRLDQIVILLETAKDSVISSNKTGLSLKVGTATLPVDIENNRGTITDYSSVNAWHGVDWSLIFSPEQLPEISTSNQLDLTKLYDAVVLLMYSSDM